MTVLRCAALLLLTLSLYASEVVTTVVGTSNAGFAGDGGQAIEAQLFNPCRVCIDSAGNWYISDRSNGRIRRVAPNGVITTVLGNGTQGYNGDGFIATAAELNNPEGVAVDAAGNVYVADWLNHRVRKLSTGGVVTTVAGTGTAGFSGDGGAATAAQLNGPIGVAVDGSGDLYIADFNNYRIRMVNSSGTISTYAGNGSTGSPSGDGGPATAAIIASVNDVTLDGAGDLFLCSNNLVRKVTPAGIITTVAGNGASSDSGDGGSATAAGIASAYGVACDSNGNLYIAEVLTLREVSSSGTIATIAGSSSNLLGYSGDGGPPTAAQFDGIQGVAVAANGNVLLVDSGNCCVREIEPQQIPGIVSATTATVTVNTSFNYQIVATSNPVFYGAAPLPTGLNLGITSGVISGTPTVVGTTPITLTATNGAGAGTATLTVTVLPPVPVITSSLAASTVGSVLNYQILATGNPTSFGAANLPVGFGVNASTGLISGASTAVGQYQATISATNVAGTGSATLVINVNPANSSGTGTSGTGTSGTGTSGTGTGGTGGTGGTSTSGSGTSGNGSGSSSSGGGGCGVGGGLALLLGVMAMGLAWRRRS
jgi:hypothetical protein